MSGEIRKMMSGAGSYFQGSGALAKCGEELLRRGFKNALIIGGERALDAAIHGIVSGLDKFGIKYNTIKFSGFCTEEEYNGLAETAEQFEADCVIGVGGGKAIDVAKAAAAVAGIAVFTVPTCAATCASYASLSVIYNDKGCQRTTAYHKDEVQGVFVDTDILAASPARYLAAGMADAMAKTCEYSSMREELSYGDVDISKYLGYEMAKASDKILLISGPKAYQDNLKGTVSAEFEDAVFCTIAATGIISGMGGFAGRTGSRFAIAHGFNEVIRGRYTDVKTWLHGEIVGVCIIAQLVANGKSTEYIDEVRDFYRSINVPTTLHDMNIVLDDAGFEIFCDEIIEHSRIAEEYFAQVRKAVAAVR